MVSGNRSILYYRPSRSYSKQSVDSSRGVGVAYEAPMTCFIFSFYSFYYVIRYKEKKSVIWLMHDLLIYTARHVTYTLEISKLSCNLIEYHASIP